MFINGIEVEFDLDIRSNFAKFAKALAILQKKEDNPSFDDMETFLRGCLKPEEVKKLLEDERISTLVNVFLEFVKNAVEQAEETQKAYSNAGATISEMDKRANEIFKKSAELDGMFDKTSLLNGDKENVS